MKKKKLLTPEIRAKLLTDSMVALVQDTRFEVFMDQVEEMKDNAQRDSISEAVVGDSNKMLAAAGEIRTYIAILDLYHHFLTEPPATEEVPEDES